MAEWHLIAYACCGLILALRLCADGRTDDWGAWKWGAVVALWPALLCVGVYPTLAACARRLELEVLTWVFVRAQRRLARLGCRFSVGP